MMTDSSERWARRSRTRAQRHRQCKASTPFPLTTSMRAMHSDEQVHERQHGQPNARKRGRPRRASTYPRNLTTQQRSNAAAQRVRSEQPKVNDLDWTQTSSHTSARRGRSWTPTSFGYVTKLSYYGLTTTTTAKLPLLYCGPAEGLTLHACI